ncbi:hypothetical protein [Phenylobacterium sp. SCN 70-31]|uniref:hypothetical protein n=1 Tax=Phenylobacterium sp. SCN 70-31 TaxID=1660129 RepID=UPI00086F83C6|nr:hypothetical protein [Phenylobacterium sp. SCN 70-31]ODT89308.1 MAG: hypothetical protein ABS78_03745 [Phenylobacterium sp. SCN 70-31]
MTTIRPNPFAQAFPQAHASQAQPPQAPAREEAGRLAAQRAFFAAATGRAQPAAAPAAETPRVPPPTVNRVAEVADPPQKILRPGSILDIRV